MPDDAAELKAMAMAREVEITAHKSGRGPVDREAYQLELLLEDEEIAAAADEAKVEKASQQKPKAQPKRKPLPEHLLREEHVIAPG